MNELIIMLKKCLRLKILKVIRTLCFFPHRHHHIQYHCLKLLLPPPPLIESKAASVAPWTLHREEKCAEFPIEMIKIIHVTWT